MSAAFDLKIVTPNRVVFEGKAASVSCPGTEGRFQVLAKHAPLLSSLDIGELDVVDEQNTRVEYAVSGGVVQVYHNAVLVLADTAERREEIDTARASAARTRAEQRLAGRTPDTDVERARASLYRALNRLKVARPS
ncbi:MAG: F0F1 ATP synthase subunit epsilon [Ignavibacteriae bacterium]|nr:F0F1 ATP synthase subunit epsilon [Ignavibacteriota bacterium]